MSNALKVGLFAIVALTLLAAMILRIEDIRLFGGPERTLIAVFDSVAGLDDKSAVRIAGVRVGRVDGIQLADRRARVRLVLEEQADLNEGTIARIANMGLLGDKYVVLEPGPAEAPPLPDGAVIPGSTPPTFDEALSKFNDLGDSLGSLGETLTQAEGDTALDRLIRNLEAMSAEMRLLVEGNRGRVEATVSNAAAVSATLARELPRLTRQMTGILERVDRTLTQVQGVVDQGRPDLQESLANMRELTGKAQDSVENLNQITGRLARGEGTIGKLLTSEEAHDELVGALSAVEEGVDSLSGAFGGIAKIQMELGVESYYLEALEESRSAFTLDIDTPADGPLYRVGVVDDPSGRTKEEIDRITVVSPDGTENTTEIRRFERTDDLTFDALLGFRLFEDTRIWAGLIESSGGVQVDYPLFDRRMLLSATVYDFDRDAGGEDLDPRIRLSGSWKVNDLLYVKAGFDDLLEDDRQSLFLGAGIRWRDDSLKYLLGSVPSF